MKDLRGRIALLTGGSRGIGPYIARALAREGVHVALAARSAGRLQDVAAELKPLGVRVLAIAADISDSRARAGTVAKVEAELGPIDLLVNNAAIEELFRFAYQSPETITKIVETNLLAPLLLSRLVLPGMIERGRGHIVSISSVHGKRGAAYQAVYSATKAGLVEWTGPLRDELKGTGVSASVICPGLVSRVGQWVSYGKTAPWFAGESAPERVAAAVVRAVRNDLHEVIVNPFPFRPLLVLKALSPSMANALMMRLGLVEFSRRIAEEREKAGTQN